MTNENKNISLDRNIILSPKNSEIIKVGSLDRQNIELFDNDLSRSSVNAGYYKADEVYSVKKEIKDRGFALLLMCSLLATACTHDNTNRDVEITDPKVPSEVLRETPDSTEKESPPDPIAAVLATPLTGSSSFSCDSKDLGCGVASIPPWRDSNGWAAYFNRHTNRALVTYADLDGDNWPEAIGIEPQSTTVWTYRPLADDCGLNGNINCGGFVPFKVHRLAGMARDTFTFKDEKTGERITVPGWVTDNGRGVQSIRVADFDGDGRDELAVRPPTSDGMQTIGLLDWDPEQGTFVTTAAASNITSDHTVSFVGDFDSNGVVDYLLIEVDKSKSRRPTGTSELVTWASDRTATVRSISSPVVAHDVVTQLIPARIWGSKYPNTLFSVNERHLRNHTLTKDGWEEIDYASPNIHDLGLKSTNPVQAAAGDIDGDGYDELFIRSGTMNIIKTVPNNSFATRFELNVGLLSDLRFADVDSDGQLELYGALSDGTMTYAYADLTGEASFYENPVPAGVNSAFSTAHGFGIASWDHTTVWDRGEGQPLLIGRHKTGLRVFHLNGRDISAFQQDFPVFEGDDAVAYAHISEQVLHTTARDLRSTYSTVSQAGNRLAGLRKLPDLAPSGIQQAAYERVRSILDTELDSIVYIRDYENTFREEILSVYSTNFGRASYVVNQMKYDQLKRQEVYNSAISTISLGISAVEGLVGIIIVGGTGAVEWAVGESLSLATQLEIMDRSETVSTVTGLLSAAVDQLALTVDDASYASTIADLDANTANNMARISTTFDERIANYVTDRSMLMRAGHLTRTNTWAEDSGDLPAMRAALARGLDEHIHKVVLPVFLDVWHCRLKHDFIPCESAGNELPTEISIARYTDFIRFLAWRPQNFGNLAVNNEYATYWGDPIGWMLARKLFEAPAESCMTNWETTCSFGFSPYELYTNKSPLNNMQCGELRHLPADPLASYWRFNCS